MGIGREMGMGGGARVAWAGWRVRWRLSCGWVVGRALPACSCPPTHILPLPHLRHPHLAAAHVRPPTSYPCCPACATVRSKFVSEHGGHTNAYTASESTNYHFDCNADALEPGLDRCEVARGVEGEGGTRACQFFSSSSGQPIKFSTLHTTEFVYLLAAYE